ncbi:class F sortase [Amnibacterium endophyticum]|uniref:Class F sortase n=1 Tax=Amnibacterium endophyticum TaxID=2109337 RepID=A0ABW4LHR7_9MICO
MRGRPVALLVALLLAMGGGTAASLHLADQRRAERSAVVAERAERTAAEIRRERGATGAFQQPVRTERPERSTAKPVRVVIPSIGVDSSLERLRRDARGVLQAPEYADEAGWWSGGVVPGHVGPAIIVGHLDTIQGDAVFVDLRRLRPGDRIRVRMSDDSQVVYRVDRSHVVDKALFPSDAVYGPTPDAQLRLITCSEPFDPIAHSYTDNLVVYATEV